MTALLQARRAGLAEVVSFRDLGVFLALLGLRFLTALHHLVDDGADERHADDDDGQGREHGRGALADFARQHGDQRLVSQDGEGRGVVVLEARQEGDDRGRDQRRLQEGQQDVPEHLRVRGAKVEGCFLLGAIEALQAGHDDQQ